MNFSKNILFPFFFYLSTAFPASLDFPDRLPHENSPAIFFDSCNNLTLAISLESFNRNPSHIILEDNPLEALPSLPFAPPVQAYLINENIESPLPELPSDSKSDTDASNAATKRIKRHCTHKDTQVDEDPQAIAHLFDKALELIAIESKFTAATQDALHRQDTSSSSTSIDPIKAITKKCPLCAFVSRAKYACSINRHIQKRHSDQCLYICKGCKKSFFTNKQLYTHQKKCAAVHPKPDLLSTFSDQQACLCKYCDETFETKRLYATHFIKEHLKQVDHSGHFCCPECSHSTPHKGHIIDHIQFRHNELCAFECRQCKKTFCTDDRINNHIENAHEELCNFICFKCSKKFCTQERWSKHSCSTNPMRTKIYTCRLNDCTYATDFNNNLKRHQTEVHGLKEKRTRLLKTKPDKSVPEQILSADFE